MKRSFFLSNICLFINRVGGFISLPYPIEYVFLVSYYSVGMFSVDYSHLRHILMMSH